METVVFAVADSDDDDIVDNVVNVEAVDTSEVVFKARLLAILSEATVWEAETEALAGALLGETKAMAVLESWTACVEAEATTQGFNNI